MGYSAWGCKESDMTERLNTIFFRKEQIPTFFHQGPVSWKIIFS